MTKKIFMVHTNHTGSYEHDPYIVLAENKQEAKQLVENTEEYCKEEESRRLANQEPDYTPPKRTVWLRRKQPPKTETKSTYALGIREVKEIPLTDSKIVWKAFNPDES